MVESVPSQLIKSVAKKLGSDPLISMVYEVIGEPLLSGSFHEIIIFWFNSSTAVTGESG